MRSSTLLACLSLAFTTVLGGSVLAELDDASDSSSSDRHAIPARLGVDVAAVRPQRGHIRHHRLGHGSSALVSRAVASTDLVSPNSSLLERRASKKVRRASTTALMSQSRTKKKSGGKAKSTSKRKTKKNKVRSRSSGHPDEAEEAQEAFEEGEEVELEAQVVQVEAQIETQEQASAPADLVHEGPEGLVASRRQGREAKTMRTSNR